MATAHSGPTPKHLWVVGILSLLWNGYGAYDYTMSHNGGLGDRRMGFAARLGPAARALAPCGDGVPGVDYRRAVQLRLPVHLGQAGVDGRRHDDGHADRHHDPDCRAVVLRAAASRGGRSALSRLSGASTRRR